MTWNTYREVKVFDHKTGTDVLVRVDLTFNVDAIARTLGAKALWNKSKKSTLSIGIKAEARRIEQPGHTA